MTRLDEIRARLEAALHAYPIPYGAKDDLLYHAPADLELLCEAVERLSAFAHHSTFIAPVNVRAAREVAWLRSHNLLPEEPSDDGGKA